ncbi:hypothetical protein ACQJBY_015469 [Aegilops geniculata]
MIGYIQPMEHVAQIFSPALITLCMQYKNYRLELPEQSFDPTFLVTLAGGSTKLCSLGVAALSHLFAGNFLFGNHLVAFDGLAEEERMKRQVDEQQKELHQQEPAHLPVLYCPSGHGTTVHPLVRLTLTVIKMKF